MKKQILFLLLTAGAAFAQVPKSMDSVLVFLKTKPQDTTYVLALNQYAFLLVQEAKIEEAKKTIVKMENLSKKFNFGNGFYKIMNMRGIIEYTNQNPQKAMDYFLECNKIIEKYKLPKKIYQNSLNNIGIVYYATQILVVILKSSDSITLILCSDLHRNGCQFNMSKNFFSNFSFSLKAAAKVHLIFNLTSEM